MRQFHILVMAAGMLGLHGCEEGDPEAGLQARQAHTCSAAPTTHERMSCFQTWDFQLSASQQDWTASVVEGFNLDAHLSTGEARWLVAFACFVDAELCPLDVDLGDDWSAAGDVMDPPDPSNGTDCGALQSQIEMSSLICKGRADDMDVACTGSETSSACEDATNAYYACLAWQDALIDKFWEDCVAPANPGT